HRDLHSFPTRRSSDLARVRGRCGLTTRRPIMLILEVMDKEPALRTVWGAALLLGLVGFLAARFRRWLVLPALGVIGFLAYWQLRDRKSTRLNSSHVAI